MDRRFDSVLGDGEQLERLVVNLLGNAVRFTAPVVLPFATASRRAAS